MEEIETLVICNVNNKDITKQHCPLPGIARGTKRVN